MSALFPRIPFYAPYTQDEAFTPYTIPTGLKYFECDFERTPQITYDGSNITTFTGPYNTNPPFTQATGADRPLWQPLAFNFRPCATFDGTDNLRNTTAVATLGFPTNGAFEIWALVEYTGSSTDQSVIFAYPSTGNTGASISVATTGARLSVGTGSATVVIDVAMSTGRHVLRAVSTGTTVRLDVDGVAGVPVVCVAAFSGTARSTIGASAAASVDSFFIGNINYIGFFRPLPAIYADGLYVALNKRKNSVGSGEWPYPVADLYMDFDFVQGRYWSGSLGDITAAQSFTTAWSSGGLVFDGNGKLQSCAPNTAPIGAGRGLWNEALAACRISFNNTLSNAAWTKTNITAVQDLPTVFSSGSVNGWRITATADGGTITHTANPVAIGPTTTMCLPYGMFYWDGSTLHGAIEITMDNFVVVTDIRDQLVANQWVQIAGIPQLIASLPNPNVFGVRIAKAGDSIGFCLANIERNYTTTTPILTPSNTTVTRGNVGVTVNTANFPTLAGVDLFTCLVVVEPRMYPLPPVGDPDMPRLGWTVLEINNAYTVTGTGIGDLVPFGGAGQGSLMTVDSAEVGSAFAAGNRMLVGTGVGSFTDIITQDSGTPGLDGTYHVNSTQPPYDDGQTTPADIVLESRLRDAMGYGFNAALKPEDDNAQRIGLTITDEAADENTGFDPQNEDYRYNEPNAEGFTLNLPELEGIVALRGDTQYSNPTFFTSAPVLNSSYIIQLGSQYLGGSVSSGSPLDGVIQRIIIFKGVLTAEELATATLVLQARYAP